MEGEATCPDWELDPYQIFPWVQVCRWFTGCSGCRLDEVEVCRCQGLKVGVETADSEGVMIMKKKGCGK